MPTSIDPQPANDEIECGRCGAYIYHDLTRCPKCGVNLYEPDDGSNQDQYLGSHPVSSRETGFFGRLDAYIRRFTKRPYPVDDLFGAAINQAGLYNDLLNKVGGDHPTVERLINYENQQLPDGNRLTWIENAIRRWEQDNRSTSVE